MTKKIAIVLLNLGGPNNQESVRPFLKNLFSDKAIIDLTCPIRFPLAWLISTLRAPKAKPLYKLMGGGSPLLPNTIAQSNALEENLKNRFENLEIKTFICMRYWHPMAKEVSKEVMDFNADEVILLPLYPQYSMTTTGSSFIDWMKNYKKPCHLINQYPKMSGFISASARLIIAEWEKLGKPEQVRILFSAHGLPQKIIDAGDPYEKQVYDTYEAIKNILPPFFETKVCFQSRVGPLKWLSPSTNDEIVKAGRDKIGVIIYPIAFVSEHIETLVELDIEYKEMAHELGIPFYGRAKTVGCEEDFINGLADIVENKIKSIGNV